MIKHIAVMVVLGLLAGCASAPPPVTSPTITFTVPLHKPHLPSLPNLPSLPDPLHWRHAK